MTRAHRSAHRRIWYVLTIAVAIGLGTALLLRPPIPIEPAGATDAGGR
jgi:hypothetical protein